MYAPELVRILQGMRHDTTVEVKHPSGIGSMGIDKVEIRPTATGVRVIIVPIGSRG